MEGIVREINEKKNIAIIAAEDEEDYSVKNDMGFTAGDILSFEIKGNKIDVPTIKKTGHINLEELGSNDHSDCASCGKCCGF